MNPRKVQFETIFSLTSLSFHRFPKQKVRKPVAMAYSLAYNNDMLMAFKALNILLLRKCDTLSMLLGSIIVTDENKHLF